MRTGLLACALVIPSVALADGMRCENKLVSTGASSLEVEQKCGEPFYVDVVRETRTRRAWVPPARYVEKTRTIDVERWSYVLEEGRLRDRGASGKRERPIQESSADEELSLAA